MVILQRYVKYLSDGLSQDIHQHVTHGNWYNSDDS